MRITCILTEILESGNIAQNIGYLVQRRNYRQNMLTKGGYMYTLSDSSNCSKVKDRIKFFSDFLFNQFNSRIYDKKMLKLLFLVFPLLVGWLLIYRWPWKTQTVNWEWIHRLHSCHYTFLDVYFFHKCVKLTKWEYMEFTNSSH